MKFLAWLSISEFAILAILLEFTGKLGISNKREDQIAEITLFFYVITQVTLFLFIIRIQLVSYFLYFMLAFVIVKIYRYFYKKREKKIQDVLTRLDKEEIE